MIRPVLAAALTLALLIPAVSAPAESGAREVVEVAAAPMTVDHLREAIGRKQEQGPAGFRRWDDGRALQPLQNGERPGPGDVRLLPDRCYNAIRTRDATLSGYAAGCMQDAVARPGDLPPQCLAQVGDIRTPRALYDARCLRSQGWSSRAARR